MAKYCTLFLLTALMAGCSSKAPYFQYKKELRSFLQDNAALRYTIDSITVDSYESLFHKLTYDISVVQVDSIQDSLSLLVPLVITDNSLVVLSPLKASGQTDDAELLTASSKKAHNYYIAVITPEMLKRAWDTSMRLARFNFSWTVKGTETPVLHIIGGNVPNNVTMKLTTSWKYELESSHPVNSSINGKPMPELSVLPVDIAPERRTYILHQNLVPEEIWSINPKVATLISKRSPLHIIILALFTAVSTSIILLILKRGLFLHKYRPHQSKWTVEDQIAQVTLLEWQILQQQEKAMRPVRERVYAGSASRPEYQETEEEINFLINNTKQLQQLRDFKKSLQKEHFASWLYSSVIIPLLLLLAFLLVWTLSFAQQNSALKKDLSNYVIKNLSIHFEPVFSGKKLQMSAFCRFLLLSRRKNVKTALAHFNVYGKNNIVDASSIKPNPIDVQVNADKLFELYHIRIQSRYHKPLSVGQLQILRGSNPDLSTLSSTDDKNFNQIYTELTIPFVKFDCRREETINFAGMKLSKFPFDETIIEIPLDFGQVTHVSGIGVTGVDRYEGSMSCNNKILRFVQKDGEIVLADGSETWLPKDEKISLTLRLGRGNWNKYIMPAGILIIFLLCFFVEKMIAQRSKEKLLWFSLLGVIFAVYAYVRSGYYSDVPNFFQANGNYNFYDIYLWFLLLVAGIIAFLRVLRARD
jgi:hypothetical protein